jgi:long-chain fatty acid transport protein
MKTLSCNSLLAATLLAVHAAPVWASGFALIEQNASGLGNAYAGQAASAQDASTVFFNPAGLTRITGTQIVVVGNLIKPLAKFDDDGTSLTGALQSGKGGEGGDAGDLALVPNFYYARDLTPDLKFGLGVSTPFGLKTEYDKTWMGRFQAVESELKTINVNPSLAFKLNDTVSLGVGVNAMYIDATLTQMANYSAAIAAATNNTVLLPNLSGLTTVEGDDWGWGYNLGILFAPTPDLRVGVSYRSRVEMTLEGKVKFANVPAPLVGNARVANGSVTADVTLPDSFSISLFNKLNDRLDLLADVSWTHWSLFDELKVDRSNGANVSTTPENWDDTWRVSLGFNYRQNDQLTWRAGLAYDQTPVSDRWRTARIPDEDRTWLAFGLQYALTDKSKLDVGYAHLFVKDSSINSTVAGQGTLSGSYENQVDILSAQYTHSF